MSKQFLPVPVENAKELIERFIADAGHGLTAWAGATVAYVEEVILHSSELANLDGTVSDVIYFGTLVELDPAASSTMRATVTDGTNDFNTFNPSSGTVGHGSYDCVMLNKTDSVSNGHFYGYKFSVTV